MSTQISLMQEPSCCSPLAISKRAQELLEPELDASFAVGGFLPLLVLFRKKNLFPFRYSPMETLPVARALGIVTGTRFPGSFLSGVVGFSMIIAWNPEGREEVFLLIFPARSGSPPIALTKA